MKTYTRQFKLNSDEIKASKQEKWPKVPTTS